MRAGRRAVPALALLALCLLFFWKMIFTNLIIARGDLFSYFYPYRDYAASALRQGYLPLWNPYLFMGAPLLANSQVGFFYPPNLLSSWLEVGRAVNLGIVTHVWFAAAGAYLFARRRLGASILAAWLSGALFGLGGYLGAQVEHFNQLQALAWIPWLWLTYEQAQLRWTGSLLAGVIVGLMLLAGHAQSVFIALVGLAVYAIWPALEQVRRPRQALRMLAKRLAPIALATIAGVLLSAVQLLPTTELTALSPRGSGLPVNEAVSFSLDPRLIGRALLPDYEGALPAGGEFTAFLGVAALLLLLVGLLTGWSRGGGSLRNTPGEASGHAADFAGVSHGEASHGARSASGLDRLPIRAISIVTCLGLFLALGGFNPIYYALVRFIPGFDLFRVPARWLALFAFGASLLAGVGLDHMGRGLTRRTRIGLVLPMALIALLIGSTFVGASVTPAGAAGPTGTPGAATLALWIATAALGIVLFITRPRRAAAGVPRSAFVLICCLELIVASRHLPYHARLTAPDALTSLRPSLTQLKAGAVETPPARFLSLSDILFDPGDAAELKSIFADQLPPDAYTDLLIASKQKEIAAPNLPLYYRLPAVDGFDGGILPLKSYLTFQRLFLSPDAIQPDGRLREQLKSIPDARWLGLMNVKYVITDKVRDRWLDGVFYDLQFSTRLGPGDEIFSDRLPPLEANALGIVYTEASGDFVLGDVELMLVDGALQRLALTDEPIEIADGLSVTRLRWRAAKPVAALRVRGSGGLTLRGVALIDERSQAFHSFVLAKGGRFRLAHSGDVKVYEYLDVLPRAFVVPQAVAAASDDEAIAIMQRTDFDPSRAVVVSASASVAAAHATRDVFHASRFTRHVSRPPLKRSGEGFTHYSPELISLEVASDSDGYLVLTDAWYPGWTASVDGTPVEILRADVTFRAVPVGAGTHQVEFRFEPQSFRAGALISGGAWLVALLAIGGVLLRKDSH